MFRDCFKTRTTNNHVACKLLILLDSGSCELKISPEAMPLLLNDFSDKVLVKR